MYSDARLDKIEKMCQVLLEAFCSLAKEITGRSMVIGCTDAETGYLDVTATPLSDSVKWVTEGELSQSDVSQESEARRF